MGFCLLSYFCLFRNHLKGVGLCFLVIVFTTFSLLFMSQCLAFFRNTQERLSYSGIYGACRWCWLPPEAAGYQTIPSVVSYYYLHSTSNDTLLFSRVFLSTTTVFVFLMHCLFTWLMCSWVYCIFVFCVLLRFFLHFTNQQFHPSLPVCAVCNFSQHLKSLVNIGVRKLLTCGWELFWFQAPYLRYCIKWCHLSVAVEVGYCVKLEKKNEEVNYFR